MLLSIRLWIWKKFLKDIDHRSRERAVGMGQTRLVADGRIAKGLGICLVGRGHAGAVLFFQQHRPPLCVLRRHADDSTENRLSAESSFYRLTVDCVKKTRKRINSPATMPQAIAHSSKLMRKCTRRQATKSFDRGRARGRPWLWRAFPASTKQLPSFAGKH